MSMPASNPGFADRLITLLTQACLRGELPDAMTPIHRRMIRFNVSPSFHFLSSLQKQANPARWLSLGYP